MQCWTFKHALNSSVLLTSLARRRRPGRVRVNEQRENSVYKKNLLTPWVSENFGTLFAKIKIPIFIICVAKAQDFLQECRTTIHGLKMMMWELKTVW